MFGAPTEHPDPARAALAAGRELRRRLSRELDGIEAAIRDYKTTAIYADYAPSAHERELVERAFETARASRGEPPRTLAEQD